MSIQLVEPPAVIATSPMQETCLSPNRFAMMPAGRRNKGARQKVEPHDSAECHVAQPEMLNEKWRER
jgi:hypothetical protein